MHLLAVFALLAAPTAASQTDTYPTKSGTAGVAFALPGGGAPTIGVTYFVANDTAVRADFGLDATFSPSGTPAGFTIGVGLRFYQIKRDRVGVFLQPSILFGRDRTAPAEFLAFAGAVGVEYFFTNYFSAGATLGLALNLTNISGPVGSTNVALNTSTSGLFANIYF